MINIVLSQQWSYVKSNILPHFPKSVVMLLDIEQYVGVFLDKNDNIGTHYFSWNHEDVMLWKGFPQY